jgi:hypothetical protein
MTTKDKGNSNSNSGFTFVRANKESSNYISCPNHPTRMLYTKIWYI